MNRIATRRLLAYEPVTRAVAALPRLRYPASRIRHNSTLPSVTQASFWVSLIPKPFRRSSSPAEDSKPKIKSKEWNPATFFIVIFLLIGSMSINTIAIKTDHANFVRLADVRIGLLREVVEKLQRGEKVDVEEVLGAGDPAREKEWEEMLQEIENDNAIRNPRKKERQLAAEEPKAKVVPPSEPEPIPSETASKPSSSSSSAFY